MKSTRVLMLAAAILGFTALTAPAEDATAWQTDFSAAKALAARENRPLLVLFTGSDWCGYCIRLESHVLSQPEFAEWVKESKVIPVKLDFPVRKAQTAEERKQNKALQKQYRVSGFPTMLILDADGKVLGRIEGFAGIAEDYLAELRGQLPKK